MSALILSGTLAFQINFTKGKDERGLLNQSEYVLGKKDLKENRPK